MSLNKISEFYKSYNNVKIFLSKLSSLLIGFIFGMTLIVWLLYVNSVNETLKFTLDIFKIFWLSVFISFLLLFVVWVIKQFSKWRADSKFLNYLLNNSEIKNLTYLFDKNNKKIYWFDLFTNEWNFLFHWTVNYEKITNKKWDFNIVFIQNIDNLSDDFVILENLLKNSSYISEWFINLESRIAEKISYKEKDVLNNFKPLDDKIQKIVNEEFWNLI